MTRRDKFFSRLEFGFVLPLLTLKSVGILIRHGSQAFKYYWREVWEQ
jgi:hypothetical protein